MSSLSPSCPGVLIADDGVNVEVFKALRLKRASLEVRVVGSGVDRDTARTAGKFFKVSILS